MRIVLYDHETLEPITIADILHWRDLGMPEGATINVPLPPKLAELSFKRDDTVPYEPSIRHIRIRFEELRRNGRSHWMAFTDDPESALTLRATFLPGQRGTVNELQQKAFLRGVVAALNEGRWL